MTTASYQVIVQHQGADLYVGSVVFTERLNGWRFMPRFQSSPSRKAWPTPEQALNRRVKNYRLQTIDGVAKASS